MTDSVVKFVRWAQNLEEQLLLMSHVSQRSKIHIKATPRVLAPVLLQIAALVVAFRSAWLLHARKKGKMKLLKREETEEWMHIQEILGSYRPKTKVVECVCSVGGWHNETFNIWSHFFAAVYFGNAFVFARRRFARWQAACACYLFTISTIAHSSGSCSQLTHRCAFGLDRASIAIYFYSVSLFVCHACFDSGTRERFLWKTLTTITGFGASSVLAGVPVSPPVGASILISQMAFGCLPVLRNILITDNEYIRSKSIKYLTLSAIAGCSGAAVFSTRQPETYVNKYYPGLLDNLGNSHNLMHFCVGMATFFAFRGCYLWELELQRGGKLIT